MAADPTHDPTPPTAADIDHPIDTADSGHTPPHTTGGQPPQIAGGSTDTISRPTDAMSGSGDTVSGSGDTVDALLLSVAHGNHDAFAALQSRMAGLVRLNVRRVLCDATRSEAVTQQTFDAVLQDATQFDPHENNAQTWLLTRAHRHATDGLHPADGPP